MIDSNDNLCICYFPENENNLNIKKWIETQPEGLVNIAVDAFRDKIPLGHFEGVLCTEKMTLKLIQKHITD